MSGGDRGLLGAKPEPGLALLGGRDTVVGDETAGLFGHAGVVSNQGISLEKVRQLSGVPTRASTRRSGPYRARKCTM